MGKPQEMKILKALIIFTFAFCLQGFLFNGLLFDVLPIMPMWLRLLPFYIAKALFTTTEGILYPEVSDFIAVVFFNFINTILTCFVLYALWSLYNKRVFINLTLRKTGAISQNKKYLLLGPLAVLIVIQLCLFCFWPTLWFEHPNWLKVIVESFNTPITVILKFLIDSLASIFNAIVFLLAIYCIYRLLMGESSSKPLDSV
jgi:hypothetical protein